MENHITEALETGDDIVRVRQSTLIGLHRDAKNIPLFSNSINAQRAGSFLSTFRGRGMEFHESRPYQAGDDIRSIDWRVTARSGRTHTKVYREERERPVLLWVDLCHSMFFGTRSCFKSVLAAKLAALLAWSSVQHGDRLGGLIFSERDHFEFRPRSGKASALHLIRNLTSHATWDRRGVISDSGEASLLALNRLRQVARPGSLVVLISDFRFFDDSWRTHLSKLSRHNDVVLLFTHDPLEQELPPAGYYRFTNGMSQIAIDSSNEASRQQYQQRFDAHYQALEQLSRQLRLHLVDASTDSDLLEIIRNGFGARS